MNDFFNESGQRIPLGKKLGSGGEGEVYEVPILGNDFAAKIYHKSLSVEKQNKLRIMTQVSNEALRKISAWPISTLHHKANGPINGFIMPKVIGYKPIHELYGPAHRKQFFPDADWTFLIFAARNVAAAFETIHSAGHIVGDVNQGNIFVASNSLIKLIDCDSFQITTTGKHYLCDVGVAHFNPPELQGKSFSGVHRTKNHDNFGLAITIFHLLMMGRHPFAGVYAGHGEMPLEKAIQEFRFAYGIDTKAKGMTAPPNTLPLSIFSHTLSALFENAFSSIGIKEDARPSAKMWVQSLDELKSKIHSCNQVPIHKYFNELGNCPWCVLESKSGVNFFIPKYISQATNNTTSNFNIEEIWRYISSISSPGQAPEIKPANYKVIPVPVPSVLKGLFGFFKFEKQKQERQNRTNYLNYVLKEFNKINSQWVVEAGESIFLSEYKKLNNFHSEYVNIGKERNNEYQKLQSNIKEKQRFRYLNRFFISDHNIPKIGPSRKLTLASYGIETAADVSNKKILSIKGFGQSYVSELVNWQKELMKGFVFDSKAGINAADIDELERRFLIKRKNLEDELKRGIDSLNQSRNEALNQRKKLLPIISEAANKVAQAQANLKVLG